MTESASGNADDLRRPAAPPPWVSSGATDLGAVRKLNEDAFLERSDVGLWVVADGMGGHSAGDFASTRIVESLQALAVPDDREQFADAVEGTLLTVHDELMGEAERRGPRTVIGSTVLATLLAGDRATTLWAGDSRLYRLRGGVLSQLTRDHSLVQDLVEAGELTPEQAEHHPQSNIITRAVGAGEELEIERRTDRVAPGDILLLCSDGLGRVVPPEEIIATLRETPVEAAARALIDKALAFRTTDNVTAIVVRVDAVPSARGTADTGDAGADEADDTDEPTEPAAATPDPDDTEATQPLRPRPEPAGAAPIDAPDFSTEPSEYAEADPHAAFAGARPLDAVRFDDNPGDAAGEGESTSDWEPEQLRDLTMIGVPPSPRRPPSSTPDRRDEVAGRSALRGWPAVLLVVAGFAVILAALYLF